MPKNGILLDRRRWLSRTAIYAVCIETIGTREQQLLIKLANFLVKAVPERLGVLARPALW
jgi:hypothetical protein